jgi:RNA polymerase sigma-70 factor (ECF subfamily)
MNSVRAQDKVAHRSQHLSVVKSEATIRYEEMSDSDLVLYCQRKDPQALNQLLKRHKRTIRFMFYKLAPDWKDNSDLVQETFIRVWRSIDRLRNPNKFKSWLNQIVTNLFYDELRKRPTNLQIFSIDEPIMTSNGPAKDSREIPDSAQHPEERALSSELSDVLQEAMSQIPDHYRIAVILRDVDGLSYEEIAKVTSAELGTVKSRIARARVRIQQRLSPYLENAA